MHTVVILPLGVKLLGMLPGIERPALMSRIPSATGYTNLLDLGANLNVSAAQLVQFEPSKHNGAPLLGLRGGRSQEPWQRQASGNGSSNPGSVGGSPTAGAVTDTAKSTRVI